MTYEEYVGYSNSLVHAVYGPPAPPSLRRKRTLNFKPKYIAKVGNRYFYTNAEYDAYKRNLHRPSAPKNPRNPLRDSYNRAVRENIERRRSDHPVQGALKGTNPEKTSFKKRIIQMIQKNRPMMVRFKNSIRRSIRELRKTASAAIARGQEIANSMLSYANTKIGEFRGVAAWKITEFRAKARNAINRGKQFIKSLFEYREKKQLGDEFRTNRVNKALGLARDTNTERRPAEIPEWMRRRN